MRKTRGLAGGLLALCWWGSASAEVATQEVAEVETAPQISPADLWLDPQAELLVQAEELLKQGQNLEAITVLRKVLQQEPRHRHGRLLVANALAQLNHTREAIRILDELIAEMPENFTILNNLAWLLATTRDASLRDAPRAVQLARQALLMAPINYSIWSTLAEAYYQAGDYTKALRAAEEASRLGTLQEAPTSNLATYAEQARKCREAVQAFSLIDQ